MNRARQRAGSTSQRRKVFQVLALNITNRRVIGVVDGMSLDGISFLDGSLSKDGMSVFFFFLESLLANAQH